MKSVIRLAALALLLMPVLVSAQEPQLHPLAGTWSTVLKEDGVNGPEELLAEFRIQGDVVNGPIFANGVERYIKAGGAVTANTITFITSGLGTDDADRQLVWTGQLSGDNQLAFTIVPEANDAPAVELVMTKRPAITGGGR